MDPLIYTAVSGATRNLFQQQISSNNLSNANTQGFRADLERGQSVQVPGNGFNSRYMVEELNAGINMTAGSMQQTGRELDIAIKGAGLIALQGPGGRELYTRNGSIDVDTEGRLTISGRPVIGDNGPIQLPPFSAVDIGNDGTITIIPEDGNVLVAMDVDRIKLVDIPANRLTKNQEGMLVSNRRTNPASDNVQVASQHLETSNVSAIGEMLTTISLNRHFEAQIKMMKAAEDLAQTGNRLLRNV